MNAQSATSSIVSATRSVPSWVWRDASCEGLVAGAAPQTGAPPRGCF